MIDALVSFLAVACFVLALWKSKIVAVAVAAGAAALSGLSTMTNPDLDDDAKETAVRRAAFSLLGATLSIAVRFALVLGVSSLPILIADFLGVATAGAVSSLMLRWDYVLVISLVAVAVGEVLRRSRRRKSPAVESTGIDASGSGYSEVDRFLHSIAFSSPTLQRGVSRLEDGLLCAARVDPEPPIFVTSLARGGTTAVLNALSRMPGVATHTYRDMPFLTAPLLWDKLAGGQRRSVKRRDRAHGDGMKIDLDSPEAFEEVLWMMHWAEKYHSDGIELWADTDRKPDADRFLAAHMTKIVRARFGKSPDGPVRYCSKNNANIARLSYLPSAFPDCRIVVPIRQPARHAMSLHRQHQNFLTLQSTDSFIRRYMSDIGHFEFGQIYRPLKFPGFDPRRYDPASADHWLDYWIHAFRAVEKRLSAGQRIVLVTQDSLRERPKDIMQELVAHLDIALGSQARGSGFLSTPDLGKDDVFCTSLLKEAREVYDRLSARALLAR